ncbi:helix-turn-helix domain-containing protein [Streptomyces sp. NPDC057794]|uniref:helix-turn-helix domain-containing protein n=1 Tax=Streptomyces sp. NPDC057794 TaxID=3346251 RepID=UPI00368C18E3
MGQALVEIGALLRGARCAKRLTQAQVGEVCGYSASAVSRIEAGKLRLDYGSLIRFAAFLDIPSDRLCASAVPDIVNVATVAGGCRSDEEDAVRRRELLTGVAAAGATAVVGAGPASAASPPDDLELSLFRLPQAEPVPLPRLVGRIAVARRDFCATEYSRLGRVLPGLIASAEATRDATPAGRAREEASVAVARAYVLAAELAAKQHSDAAWVAADRALSAARSSGIPVAVGEASRVLAIAMRRSGRSTAAVHLLTKEAEGLDANRDHTGAVRTTLLLTGAYSAAAGRDRTTALALLEEAEQEADRRPAVPGLFTVEATRTQVDVYRIGVMNMLGTPDEAVEVAAGLDVSHLPTPERRARAWTDVARMWNALGDGPQTFTALRQVQQEAPQEVRRPALRALTAGLLYGPAQVPGLREFAARTGALSA